VPFLIGTDEAGYGPNLGPLTITGTLWESQDAPIDLYRALDEIVSDVAIRRKTTDKIFVADSKKVYSGSILGLELGVMAMIFASTGRIPNSWQELSDIISPRESVSRLADQVWLTGQELKLPLKAAPDEIQRLGETFRDASDRANVRLQSIQCVPVFPPQFNSRVDELGNKATLLSTETLKIVRRLMDKTDDDVEIGCDKHGGRSRYAALIQEILTDELVTVGIESLELSDYTFRESDRDVFIRFQAKGETFLPTALASMVAKYVREVFMMLWNEFWKLKIPEIKPTKGYPLDAKRFKSEIAAAQLELGIDDHSIWRKK